MRRTITNIRTLSLILAGSLLPAGFALTDPVHETDALTLQWTGLEHQKDLLQANWRTQKPVLEQQLSLLEREQHELTDLLATSARKKDEVEQKRLELLEQQTRFEQEQDALQNTLMQAAVKLRAIHARLPPPLFEGWSKDLPRLDDPKLTATEKLQLVLQLLGQLNDFEQKITLNEAVMKLADGQDHVVEQVYLGLSNGWYVTADQRFAAAGMAGPDGWQWSAAPDPKPIAQIVAILQRREDPQLVSIPIALSVQPAVKGR